MRVLKLTQVTASHFPFILEETKELEVQNTFSETKLSFPNNKKIENRKKVQNPVKVMTMWYLSPQMPHNF